ncbi:MAG: type II secretion system protein [Planctomycetes bacterium]|nr:type II secretion system protein [Planctomycetota bacterium]
MVAIIATLIGIALPSFTGARRQAKNVASRQVLTTLESAIESYRTERALGGRLPPSASDANGSGVPPGSIIDPLDGSVAVPSSGATLLVLALAGPDKQGTAGFRPEGAAGTWADSIGGFGSGGMYDTNPATRFTPATRYGSYAGATAMEHLTSIGEVRKKGFKLSVDPAVWDIHANEQLVFTDLFNSPVLYYKARKAARRMITDARNAPIKVGKYDHRDNSVLTTFNTPPSPHRLAGTRYDDPLNPPLIVPLVPDSFDSFIIDRTASRFVPNDATSCLRAVPQRADDYLLISAGSDGIWGTKDDVTNWK